MSSSRVVSLERFPDERIAVLTLERSPLNAIDEQVVTELAEATAELVADSETRAVLVRSALEGVFMAGADIREFERIGEEGMERALLAQEVFACFAEVPQPTIAAINGHALGGGLELALACDFRVAAEDAQLGLPEIGLGMIPGSGGTQRLARLVGLGRAKDVILRRRRIDAREALAWGLVSEVVAAAELDAAVDRVIDDLDGLSPLALRTAKRVLNHVYDAPLSIGLELEGLAYGMLRSTDDFREGVEAFGEKRPPRFEGR
jgi:2-oxoglutaroyl-CoA hydrolase